MRVRILVYFSLMLCLPSALFAQGSCTHILAGRIQSETGEVLAGATIALPDGRGVVADAKGEFRLEKLCAGRYVITIQFIGFQKKQTEVVVPGASFQQILLKAETRQLEEVTVKGNVAQAEHNQNIDQLTSKQLNEVSGKALGEALKEIPGVNSIQAGPGIFKPVIHGVHSQRILILNHGIRQEGQQWGAEHAPEIDPFVASNITVVKDASAIKYGTDALGGVIIVNPAELPEAPGLGGAFHSVLQSNGRSATLSGVIEGGVNKVQGMGWRVQGTAKRAGDFNTPDYSLTNTGVRELNFSSAAGIHRERFGVEGYFSHFESTLGILRGTSISNLDDLVVAMESETPQYTSDFSYELTEPRQKVKHNLLKLNGHLKTSRGDWRFQYGYQNNQRQEFDIRRGNLSSIPSINLRLNTHSLETEWEVQRTNRLICSGITAMVQDNQNIPGTQRIPFIPNFTSISAGAFFITKYNWKNVTLDAGGRYDLRSYDVSGYDFKNTLYNESLIFHNASLTAGATFKLNARSAISSNLSSAWRPPHVAELYSLGTHQSAAAIEYGLLLNDQTNEVMDIDAVPFNVEQAMKWVNTYSFQNQNLSAEITAFGNYIFNYIYLKPFGITQNVRGVYPYFRYTQTDAMFLGVDISVNVALTRLVNWNSKASLLQARDVANDDFLVFIPSNRYETALRFEPTMKGLGNFYSEVKLKFVQQQNRTPKTITVRQIKEAQEQGQAIFGDGRNFDFMDAPTHYLLVQAAVGFTVPVKKTKLDFRFACENGLNQSYREYTNRFRYYADELGRNFILSIKYVF